MRKITNNKHQMTNKLPAEGEARQRRQIPNYKQMKKTELSKIGRIECRGSREFILTD